MNETYNKSHKVSLFIALLIPLLVISAVIFAVYFPGNKFNLDQDFLYAVYLEPTGSRYSYFDEYSMRHIKYSVKDGSLTKTIVKERDGRVELDPVTGKEVAIDPVVPKLYIYDHIEGKSIEVTEDKATEFSFDKDGKNDKGFTVSATYVGSGMSIFGGGGNYGVYAVGKNSREKIDIQNGNENNFRFIGWIENK